MSASGSAMRLRTHAFGLLTTAIVLVFALAEFGTAKYVSERSRVAGTALEIIIVVLATLAFRPIHHRVEVAVEAAFTRRRREARDSLSRLRRELSSFNDTKQVLRRVVDAVDQCMGCGGCAIYLWQGNYAAEVSSFDAPLMRVESDDALIVRLRSSAAPADPRAFASSAGGELAFPMMAAGDLIGFLVVTPKRVKCELEDRQAIEGITEAAAAALVAINPRLRPHGPLLHNLPRIPTSFIARDAAVCEVTALLEDHALVSLVGPGGVGKTRLSLEVAASVMDKFEDGVWFVELAPISKSDHIASTIASAMGLRLAHQDDMVGALVEDLRTKHALLVLDNCEHVIEPAAPIVALMLRLCPTITVLASSRQNFGVAGERTYQVRPLDVPGIDAPEEFDADDARRFAAVELFVERACAASAHFALTDENATVIVEICRRLDGIPLAIELAAPKTAVLAPSDLLEKLSERFRLLARAGNGVLPHQQTLRALIDWSFDVLDADERAVFRRLSIFAGGWTLKAAAAVCADDRIDDWKVLDVLSALVGKSLVGVHPHGNAHRYDMLFTIREYARERLTAEREDATVAAKHARYHAAIVRELAPLVESLEDVRWQHELIPEIGNIRAALEWTILRGHDPDAGLSLLAHVEWPELLTTPQEAISWFDAAEKNIGALEDHTIRARVLRHHVRLQWLVGRTIAKRQQTASLALEAARASLDPNETARSLANLASIYRDAAQFDEAEDLFSQAYREPDALSTLAVNTVLRNWAIANLQRGDLETARQRFLEVASKERPGSEAHASAQLNLGELEFAMNNPAAAREASKKASEAFAHLNAAPQALAVCNQAAYALAMDDVDDARALLHEALHLLRKSGARWMITALEHHALLAALVGDYERAVALFGFTQAHYEANNDTRQRTEQAGCDRLVRILSREYDKKELAARMKAGASLSGLDALHCATAISQSPKKPLAASAAG